MWQKILEIGVAVAPILVSVISLIVHFFVFHRLKCTKELAQCLKEDFPDFIRMRSDIQVSEFFSQAEVVSSLISRVEKLEAYISALEEVLKNA